MQRKTYPIEYKKQAVMVALSGARNKSKLARDIGITENMLRNWIAKYGYTVSRDGRTAQTTDALQEWLRDEHNRRLDFIYREAAAAWAASRGEKLARCLAKFQQVLIQLAIPALPAGDELQAKLLDSARTIFSEQCTGDASYLRNMLATLADMRKMWDANLTVQKAPTPAQAPAPEEPPLTDEERVTLILRILEEARENNTAAATFLDSLHGNQREEIHRYVTAISA